MSGSCAEWRANIGACIVGALEGHELVELRRHLAVCSGCRTEYEQLVPVRSWLDRLTLPDVTSEPGYQQWPGWLVPVPGSDGAFGGAHSNGVPAPRAPRPLGARQDRWRRIPRVWRRVVPAAAAALAGAVILVVLVMSGPATPSFQATDGATGVSGHAQLHATPTGTEIDLTASGLPSAERCVLVAVGRSGTDIAGTWEATYYGSARISGTSAYPPAQLIALRIETETGHLLLSIRV